MERELLADQVGARLAAGQAASDDGQPASAVRELRSGLRLLDGSGQTDQAVLVDLRARLLVSLAWAESERGRVDAGFRLLAVAEPLVPSHRRGILVAQRALMLSRSGRDDLASTEYDAAVALLEDDAAPVDLVRVLNNRSLVHLDAGRIGAARMDLQRCVEIARAHDLRLHLALATVNLGCLDVLAGDLPAALGAFSEARQAYQELAPGRLPSLAVERARALLAAGLFQDADRELEYAVEQARTQRLSHTEADALLARAEAALLAGRHEAGAQWAAQAQTRFLERSNVRRAALAALLQVRAVRPADPDAERASAVRALSLAGRLSRLGLPEDARVAGLVAVRALVRTGRIARASQVLDRYGRPGRLDRLDTRLLWHLARAELAAAERRPAVAGRQLNAGLSALRRYRGRFGSLDLQTGASAHGQDLARTGLATALGSGSAADVLRWVERSRAQALLFPPVRRPDHPAAAAQLAELRQARHTLRTAELAGRSVPGLGARIEALERAMREESWSIPGVGGGVQRPVSASRLRASLDGAVLVAYVRDGPRLHAVVVGPGPLRLVSLAGYDAAAEAATRLRADLATQAGRVLPGRLAKAVQGATRHDAQLLSSAVLDPLLPLIGDRDLVVVPTGALFTAPWSVLPACRGRPVTVAPSATSWQASQARVGPVAAGSVGPMVLVAGPGTQRGDAEVAEIATIRPESQVLTGEAATPAATLAALGSSGVAHLAAHGHHQSENALFSSLDLAGGPLFGYDLTQRRTPRMVVLSCCDLGRSDIRPGDETLGMAAALLAGGTATVIASVARVGDDLAMAVMTEYHRGIGAGLSASSSLARATATADEGTGFVCFGAG